MPTAQQRRGERVLNEWFKNADGAEVYSAASMAGMIVTLSPQPQASVWFGLRNVNFECSGVTS
jgi:hypothetical protein